jgi:hypothetical protein
MRNTNAGTHFGDEQAEGRGDENPLPPENSGVDGEMDDTGRTHHPVTRAEEDDTNLGLPDRIPLDSDNVFESPLRMVVPVKWRTGRQEDATLARLADGRDAVAGRSAGWVIVGLLFLGHAKRKLNHPAPGRKILSRS